MNQIKAIIFDIGGVLNHINFKKYYEDLEKYCDYTANEIHKFEREIRTKLDLGQISKYDYCEFLQKKVNLRMNPEELFEFINNYKKMNFELLDFIKNKLKNKFKLYILSNNSQVFVTEIEHQNYDSLFDKIFYSFEMHIRKPEHKIYQMTLNEIKLKPKECLFIDDKEANLLSAQKLDINVYLFEDNKKFFKFAKNNLLK